MRKPHKNVGEDLQLVTAEARESGIPGGMAGKTSSKAFNEVGVGGKTESSAPIVFPQLGHAPFSRRSSSRSTASRMKSDCFSPSRKTAFTRASVPARNLPGVCSSLIFGLPTLGRVSDITF